MQVQFIGGPPVYLLQETEPVHIRVLFGTGDNLAIEIIQGRRQGNSAVANVIICFCPNVTNTKRQSRPSTIKSLALSFSSQHNTKALSGGSRYSPMTFQNFSSKAESFDTLKVRTICGFRSFFFQIWCTLCLPRDTHFLRHAPYAPAGPTFWWLSYLGYDRIHFRCRQGRLAASSRSVSEPL